MDEIFKKAYEKLNPAQRDAVDSIDGPVMVIAGPGTGKTQILALRIANILKKTDTGADGILCLTFTNSGVYSMRNRLGYYIGESASKIKISTFHSFANSIVDEFFDVLDLEKSPTLMDETESVYLIDEILENNSWQYLRPRGDNSKYFRDIKSLISLLKRENMTPQDFLISINEDIKRLETDETSISTRGESKGKLKKEVENQIERLNRTKEIVKFYEEYEKLKKERAIMDYDDVIRYAYDIVKQSDDAKASLCERYLYVLVDEHQDSSSLQNNLLHAIWDKVEKPNIFVVGDDRQLIYGFGGASIEYFENFKTLFGKAKLITLIENYRSTQAILDMADFLLKSELTQELLKSNHPEMHPLNLVECAYPRDEIIEAANQIKEKINEGIDPNECAILVPKNYQVKNAVQILRDQGLQVASSGSIDLFECKETASLINVLRIVNDPYDKVSIGNILFDPIFNIPPLLAHKFIQNIDIRKLSIEDLINPNTYKDKCRVNNTKPSLISSFDAISNLGLQLEDFINKSSNYDVYELIQYIGEKLLIDTAKNHDDLITRVEVVRTMLHLALLYREKSERENKKPTIATFLEFIDRLQNYNQAIPLAVFNGDQGVKVLTLHSSKGLEFDYVWVAHMDESNLMNNKHQAFALPESISVQESKKDTMVAKREIYVALTRAKRFCTFSYARYSYNGREQMLSSIINDLPKDLFNKKEYADVELETIEKDPKAYIAKSNSNKDEFTITDLTNVVSNEYQKLKVSVTMLNNFFECPWKWYFRNLLRLPDVLTESLIFGNVVHGSIEQILKGNIGNLDEIVLEQIHKQNIYDDAKIKRFSFDANKILSAWIKNRLPTIEPNHISERSVPYNDPKFPNLSFYGKIDLTENLKDGGLRVTDFKTGSVKTKNEIEKESVDGRMSDYLRQLAMYSYLIKGNQKNIEIRESQLEFLEAKDNDKNSIYKTTISDEQIDLLIRDIAEYDNELKNGSWVNRECNYKSYGNKTECPYCLRAQIYN